MQHPLSAAVEQIAFFSYKATAFKICRRVRLSELIGLKKPNLFRVKFKY
jgi:hypothetical protein